MFLEERIVWALRQSRRFSKPSGGFAVNARIATRDRMRRHGVEDVKGKMPFVAELPKSQPRRKLSEAELRQQTAAAFLAWRAGQTFKDK